MTDERSTVFPVSVMDVIPQDDGQTVLVFVGGDPWSAYTFEVPTMPDTDAQFQRWQHAGTPLTLVPNPSAPSGWGVLEMVPGPAPTWADLRREQQQRSDQEPSWRGWIRRRFGR